jgi:hypothetical protein
MAYFLYNPMQQIGKRDRNSRIKGLEIVGNKKKRNNKRTNGWTEKKKARKQEGGALGHMAVIDQSFNQLNHGDNLT